MTFLKKKKGKLSYRPVFLLLHKKIWYQLKFLIKDLISFSLESSFIFLKETNNLCLFKTKKLKIFYEKFKKILKKYLSSQKINNFLINLVKTELIYLEDKIIFIENEIYLFRQIYKSRFCLNLIVYILSKYYIFLNNTMKKKNWIYQCFILRKKFSNQKKRIGFWQFLSRLTSIFLSKNSKKNISENYHQIYSLIFTNKKLKERKKIASEIRKVSNKHIEKQKGHNTKMEDITKLNSRPIKTQPKFLHAAFSNGRRNMDKHSFFFEKSLTRSKRKLIKKSIFFEKPSFHFFFDSFFFSNLKKKILDFFPKKKLDVESNTRFRWSVFSKLFKIKFREIIFFSLGHKEKNSLFIVLCYPRQLLEFSFSQKCSNKVNPLSLNDQNIQRKKILFSLVKMRRNFCQGWSILE